MASFVPTAVTERSPPDGRLEVVHHCERLLQVAAVGAYDAEQSAAVLTLLESLVDDGRLPPLLLFDFRRTRSWAVSMKVSLSHTRAFLALQLPAPLVVGVLSPHRRSGIVIAAVAKVIGSRFQLTHHTTASSALGYLQSKAEALGLPPPPTVVDASD